LQSICIANVAMATPVFASIVAHRQVWDPPDRSAAPMKANRFLPMSYSENRGPFDHVHAGSVGKRPVGLSTDHAKDHVGRLGRGDSGDQVL
jgi:hypothetical protein